MSNTASYIGKEPTYGVFITQTETGDGSTVAFSLDATVATTASLLVSVGGVVQQPASAFNINAAGTTLTFTAAPGSSIPIWILFLGQTLVVPQASSANTTMITGESAITSLAATDDFLVYDADAAAMKKVQYQYVHSGVADMAANTVKVRDANSTGAPSDKAVTDTQLLIGDGTGFTAAALSGDATMTNAGVVSIASGVIVDADVNASAAIAATKLSGVTILTGSTNNTITTVTAANAISGEANFTYDGTTVAIKNSGTASDVKLYCESSNAHSVSIKSAAHAAYTGGSWTLTLPGTDGAADEFLKTNGAGLSSWSAVPAGAPTGGGTDKVFFENEQTVDTDYTLTSSNNAVSAGPVTVSNGITVTVPAGAAWVIV